MQQLMAWMQPFATDPSCRQDSALFLPSMPCRLVKYGKVMWHSTVGLKLLTIQALISSGYLFICTASLPGNSVASWESTSHRFGAKTFTPKLTPNAASLRRPLKLHGVFKIENFNIQQSKQTRSSIWNTKHWYRKPSQLGGSSFCDCQKS